MILIFIIVMLVLNIVIMNILIAIVGQKFDFVTNIIRIVRLYN
jgi:hypothetical protein